MKNAIESDYTLNDGSRIAVIGGGPAGSFFAYFSMYFAKILELDIAVDIYEPKAFGVPGPAGCNHCGGIISESLIQLLSTEGIVLPPKVIRRGIESYTLHLEQGSVEIKTPQKEQRIASVFRGFGPKGSNGNEYKSFDAHLLKICKKKGVNVIGDKVKELEKLDDGVIVKTGDNEGRKYDLVVGAAGLNLHTLKLFKSIHPKYNPPKTTKTHICEFYLDSSLIDTYFGNSMHVFLLNLPNIKFGALVPKGNYVTLVLLGDEINKEIVGNFLSSPVVKNCFPKGKELQDMLMCQCYPSINIQGARSTYADRMILIGDSASSKLYKNGIGSAYVTAKAAAKTALFEGVSEKDFQAGYQNKINTLDRDNSLGKLIFSLTGVIQKSSILKNGLFNTVLAEQRKENNKRNLSSILWDTFTGSAPYKNIMWRGLHPRVGASFLYNMFK